MKYKGVILIILIAIGAAALFLLPDKKIYEKVASVGKPAPDFAYPDSNGKIWRLSDLRGKVVFINFWATWCTTCKAEMPHKESLFQKMKGKPFQMLGMLFRDDPQNLTKYYEQQKVSPPTLISPDNEAAKIFGITGVPETFIIDKKGIIREKIVGPREWDSPENMAMIEKWL
jgi:cytochrome c biogenesis protein CcmG/thiol:disulfide interchange protein DsbE